MVQDTNDLLNHQAEKCQSLPDSPPAQPKIRLAFFSSGLGTINRGFEVSTARFFRSVKECSEFDSRLFAGSNYPDAEKVWCIGRNDWLKSPLRYFPFADKEKLWRTAYALEQTSFCFGLLADSVKAWQPEVAWTKEVPLAHVLYEFRKLSGSPYKIIFANGGGFRPKTYQQFDFVQHLQKEDYEEALAFGIPKEKMTIIPNAVPYEKTLQTREELRAEFGFNNSDWIIICVAAWNKHHKRLDYLIEEVARANISNCKLLICGQAEPEGESLQALAAEKLGAAARFMTVEEAKVRKLLHMSDLFVLCSFYEGLGTVMIEAAMEGLPVLCHQNGAGRFILEDECFLIDMSAPGNLAARLQELRQNPISASILHKLQENVQSRFNEQKIVSSFKAMVQEVYSSRSGGLKRQSSQNKFS